MLVKLTGHVMYMYMAQAIRLGLLSGRTTRSQLCGARHDMSQLAAASAACSLTSCAPSTARVVANFLIAHFIDPPSLPRSRAPASLPPRESKAPWCMVLAHKWAAKASCSLKKQFSQSASVSTPSSVEKSRKCLGQLPACSYQVPAAWR